MAKPVIAIDIDDVVAEFCPAFCDFLRERRGLEVLPEDYREDWVDWLGLSIQGCKDLADELFGDKSFYLSLPVLPGTRRVLGQLKDRYEIVAMTSRRTSAKQTTRKWLDKNLENMVGEIYFLGAYDDLAQKDLKEWPHNFTKGDLCREVGVKCLIDDQPKHCLSVAEAGIDAVLFGDYGWNRQVEERGRLMRVKGWREVGRVLGG